MSRLVQPRRACRARLGRLGRPDRRAAVLALALALALGLWGLQGQAELGSDDYLPSGPVLDAAERAQMQVEIEADRRREAARAEQAARERAAAQVLRQAELAAAAERKPEGERLVEVHCLSCHAPEVIATARHTWLGWQLSVQRMRFLHGAQIASPEALRIADHLSTTQGAGPRRVAIEYGLALMLLGLPSAAALYLATHRKRARSRERASDSADGGSGPRR